MGYVEENLAEGQNVVYDVKLHWKTFLSLRPLQWLSTEFAVTNKRVICKIGAFPPKTGVFPLQTTEVDLDPIKTVPMKQSAVGEILTDSREVRGTKEVFRDIADPTGFKKAIQEARGR
jgi:hypothetical protein